MPVAKLIMWLSLFTVLIFAALVVLAMGVGRTIQEGAITFVPTSWDYAIFSLDINTGVIHSLTRDRDVGWPLQLTCSRDNQQIAFSNNRDDQIYTMNHTGENVRPITQGIIDGSWPAWSPDGINIAFMGKSIPGGPENWDIYIVGVDGNNLRNLTDNTVMDGFPAWSPDSSHIVFSSRRDGNDEIYVMNVDGREVQRLTYSLEDDSHPVWSPDSEHIVYMSESPQKGIYVMNADGSNSRSLIPPQYDYYPQWSADSNRIVFTSQRDGSIDVYMVDVNGSNLRRLTYFGAVQPVWCF